VLGDVGVLLGFAAALLALGTWRQPGVNLLADTDRPPAAS
jgi:hypothetical protein